MLQMPICSYDGRSWELVFTAVFLKGNAVRRSRRVLQMPICSYGKGLGGRTPSAHAWPAGQADMPSKPEAHAPRAARSLSPRTVQPGSATPGAPFHCRLRKGILNLTRVDESPLVRADVRSCVRTSNWWFAQDSLLHLRGFLLYPFGMRVS